MWTATLGEVGQVGLMQMEITEPSGAKFHFNAAGAGFGLAIDPVSYLKALKAGAGAFLPDATKFALKLLLESLGKGVAFSVGDYISLITHGMPLSATGGRLVPNPIGGPQFLSRYQLVGGSAPAPVLIASAGGGVVAGMEGGSIYMGAGGYGIPGAIGVYGSSGLTMKVGVGIGAMMYSIISVKDGPGDPTDIITG